MMNITNTWSKIKERIVFLFLLCITCTIVAIVLTGVTRISNIVEIIDGANKYSVYTVQSDAKAILKQENIVLGENDTCSFTGFENNKATLNIYRAFEAKINVDGITKTVTVSNNTVKDALAKAEVTLADIDRVTPSMDTVLKPEDTITVGRVRYEEYQEKQPIPYRTEGITRELQPDEKKVVVTQGVAGEKMTTYRKVFVDGNLSETVIVADKVLSLPVNEVLKIEKLPQVEQKKTVVGDKKPNKSPNKSNANTNVESNESDLELLARLVNREIGGGSFVHKQMVAEVVLNRVKSPLFPNTIKGVIEQSGQFDDVENYWTQRKPEPSTYEAVKKAMAGSNVSKGALYFYAPAWTSASNAEWFETSLTFITEIEGHRFFK